MKRNNTLFSIIVPAYNSGAFIERCIYSVLKQTYTAFELILIDDGSNDNTLTICESYALVDPRVKVIHKKNGGHTSARNEGLKNAIGEYILFLDSDDWLSHQTLDICYNEILINDPDIIIYRLQNHDSPLPYKVKISDGCYNIRDLEKCSYNNFIISGDGTYIFPKSLSGKCFKYEIILNSQLRIPQNILLGEDGVAFVDSILKAKTISVIANNEKACYYCFVRPNSISRSSDLTAFEKATCLLLHYYNVIKFANVDYVSQFNRNVVAQLYTATLLVIRSGGTNKQLNSGLRDATQNKIILNGLCKAKFHLKGYKFIIKQFILRYRLWWLAKLLDKVGK